MGKSSKTNSLACGANDIRDNSPVDYEPDKPDAQAVGRVASLHLHPQEPGALLHDVEAIELVEAKGIVGDNRHFARLSKKTGTPTRRQVSLIEREQVAEHAAALGMPGIAPGLVRSNIETTGINLIGLLGSQVEIGDAVLLLHSPRDPCSRMDAVCKGLRERMMDNKQGVMAEVVRSGTIRRGDAIRVRR